MNILVTGATGTVGSEVVRQLAHAGHHVRAGVRSRSRAAQIAQRNVELADFDVGRPETCRAAMEGMDRVCLLLPMLQDLEDVTDRFARAARAEGVAHVVRLSAMGADDRAVLRLGRWHRAAEKALERSGVSWTHLRPNSFMQNYLTYHGEIIRSQSTFYLPHGSGRTSLIDVRDIAAVAVAALTTAGHEGRIHTLTGPAALSNQEVAAALSRATGKRIAYVDVPDEAAAEGMKTMGIPPWLAEALMELNQLIREGGAAGVTPDVRHVLGREALAFEAFATDYATLFI